MAVTLDATVGGANANSFTTVAEADAYHNNLLYASAWTSATVDDKARALITATRLIVDAINIDGWLGYPVDTVQRLPYPRSGVYTRRGNNLILTNEIPQDLKDATAEYGRRLLEQGQLPDEPLESAAADLKRLKAGPVELEFFGNSAGSVTDLPDPVYAMIAYLFEGRPGGISVPLRRV